MTVGVCPARIAGLVGAADGERPAVDRTIGEAAGLHLGLGIDFFVDPGHGHEKRRAHFQQGFGKCLHERTVGQSDAVVEHGEIDVASRDVRKRKKRNADQPGVHLEAEQRAIDVRRHVAVGQHRALGRSGCAGGVDDSGKVVGLDGAGEGFDLRIERAGPWVMN